MTKDEARQHAISAVVEILRNYGFDPDDREFPNQVDRDKIIAEYSKINRALEAKIRDRRPNPSSRLQEMPLKREDPALGVRLKDLTDWTKSRLD